MSTPATAIGSSPTDDKTENRPPTSSGIVSLRYPLIVARRLSTPPEGDVVAIMRSEARSGEVRSSHSLSTLKVRAVSRVVPDLEITLIHTRFCRPSGRGSSRYWTNRLIQAAPMWKPAKMISGFGVRNGHVIAPTSALDH